MNLERISVVAAQEAIRQKVGLPGLIRLLRAYQYAYKIHHLGITVEAIYELATIIEPENSRGTRKIPVTFHNGGSSSSSHEVAKNLNRLMESLPSQNTELVDEWIKQFLWIHPFSDGNGRLAWLLRTWLLYQWHSPENLPDYGW